MLKLPGSRQADPAAGGDANAEHGVKDAFAKFFGERVIFSWRQLDLVRVAMIV